MVGLKNWLVFAVLVNHVVDKGLSCLGVELVHHANELSVELVRLLIHVLLFFVPFLRLHGVFGGFIEWFMLQVDIEVLFFDSNFVFPLSFDKVFLAFDASTDAAAEPLTGRTIVAMAVLAAHDYYSEQNNNHDDLLVGSHLFANWRNHSFVDWLLVIVIFVVFFIFLVIFIVLERSQSDVR